MGEEVRCTRSLLFIFLRLILFRSPKNKEGWVEAEEVISKGAREKETVRLPVSR